MKHQIHVRCRTSPHGTALIPSLLIIGMVTAVVVLFFNLVTVQTRNTAHQVASNDLTSLRDIAINSVIAQLRQGTTQSDTLWISQPGALRTYQAANGTASRVYKLYSARDMTVEAAGLDTPALANLETDVPMDWNLRPAVYGDLNAPTYDAASGKLTFPIIDPQIQNKTPTESSTPAKITSPEGFTYSNSTASDGVVINGIVRADDAVLSSHQRLPMPVRWVYLLQDGSMGVMADSSPPLFVPFTGNSNASATNPIVGRMAWWTDDECAKININTASEALFWDTPRCVTNQEVHFAKTPPVRNEVQRFGGHPATTCLSTVFFPGERLIPGVGDNTTKLQHIYDLVPRVHYHNTASKTDGARVGALAATDSPTDQGLPVAFDTDRLYASIDELLLDSPAGASAPAVRQPHAIFDGDLDRLKRLRFFLTAESRAPETTASGTPRVSLWPVHFNFNLADRRTSFDNVSAFCSTLGTIADGEKIQPFHFRRSSSLTNEGEFTNSNVDYSVQIANDPWKIGSQANGNLATYVLRQATAKKSGYLKSIADKFDNIYPNKLHNTGTFIQGIMEYIRQTNLMDTTEATNGKPVIPYGNTSEFQSSDIEGQVTAIQVVRLPAVFNHADVLRRSEIVTTGIGREFAVSEFGLVFNVAAENPIPTAANPSPTPFNPALIAKLNLPPGYKAIQISPVFEAFCPGQGFSMIAPASTAECKELMRLRLSSPNTPGNPAPNLPPDSPEVLQGYTLGSPRKPGGAVKTNTPLYDQARDVGVDGVPNKPDFRLYGVYNSSVAHLAFLAGGKPSTTPPTGRASSGTWWIGWGGSGGRWLWNDNNSTNNTADIAAGAADMEANKNIKGKPQINQYSRGYFIINAADTQMTLTYDNARDDAGALDPTDPIYSASARDTKLSNTLEIMIGNQRNADYSARKFFITIPANGITMPVPKPAAKRHPTMGRRFVGAEKGGGAGHRYMDPTTTIDGNSSNNMDSIETVDENDVVRTWVTRHGDYRLSYIRLTEINTLPASRRLFVPHPGWWDSDTNTAPAGSNARVQVHSFTMAGGAWEPSSTLPLRNLVPGETYDVPEDSSRGLVLTRPDFVVSPATATFKTNQPSGYPYSVDPAVTRDWDTGAGIAPDGAYWNKPDDIAKKYDTTVSPPIPPYFQSKNWDGVPKLANQTTAPNQLIPSAVMFGSIPSAASTGLPWTTLLFRPEISDGGHLGGKGRSIKGNLDGAPPDHILLDWFWMPVVQPYAISEPFSTAGKINLNYRIAPFTYINRATGLHAVLKSEQVLAIPNGSSKTYKIYSNTTLSTNGTTTTGGKKGWRHYIDAEKTLMQWEDKFDKGEFFMNASEVCEQFLVPQDSTTSEEADGIRGAMRNFWNAHALTGDNVLERPYANIYPRLTTRSNTYRVHFKVQTLTKARSTAPDTFDPDSDVITGETQGDAVVERSIDPNDPAFDQKPEFNYIKKAVANKLSEAQSLDKLYSWRIRHIRRFSR